MRDFPSPSSIIEDIPLKHGIDTLPRLHYHGIGRGSRGQDGRKGRPLMMSTLSSQTADLLVNLVLPTEHFDLYIEPLLKDHPSYRGFTSEREATITALDSMDFRLRIRAYYSDGEPGMHNYYRVVYTWQGENGDWISGTVEHVATDYSAMMALTMETVMRLSGEYALKMARAEGWNEGAKDGWRASRTGMDVSRGLVEDDLATRVEREEIDAEHAQHLIDLHEEATRYGGF